LKQTGEYRNQIGFLMFVPFFASVLVYYYSLEELA